MESENISADNLMQIDQNEHQGASSSPSSSSRTPSSPSPPSKVVKKRQRYSYEFKQKVVAQLKTTSRYPNYEYTFKTTTTSNE